MVGIPLNPARPRGIRLSRDGFSLLELVLTLAIIAIMAAIAAPRYGAASSRYRLDLAARRVAADLRLARSYAKATSSSCTVAFDPAQDAYRLVSMPAPDGASGDYAVVLSSGPYRAELVAAGFNGVPQVVFNGWGLPDNGGTVTVAVGASEKTVVVDGGTGQVSIP